MKIALCSSFVPFVYGGARNIVEWLQAALEEHGHQVERVYLPEVDAPNLLFQQMMAYRWIDLDSADRVICFRPQAHLISHPHKILWFIHHIRTFYDLWDTAYRDFPADVKHVGIREALHAVDTLSLKNAKSIFTNSHVVSRRLKQFNNIDSEVLYPPVFQPERFYCGGYGDEIVYICRLEHHKRQHLLLEAMKHTRTDVRLRLCGASSGNYAESLKAYVEENDLEGRVILDDRWISEQEKVERLAYCLAAAYLPLDEDSYGYPSIEASHASKAVLTTSDSGGVLELVQHGANGVVVEPTAQALSEAMDQLYLDRSKTGQLGTNAKVRLQEMSISWSHVLARLLA